MEIKKTLPTISTYLCLHTIQTYTRRVRHLWTENGHSTSPTKPIVAQFTFVNASGFQCMTPDNPSTRRLWPCLETVYEVQSSPFSSGSNLSLSPSHFHQRGWPKHPVHAEWQGRKYRTLLQAFIAQTRRWWHDKSPRLCPTVCLTLAWASPTRLEPMIQILLVGTC